ncbi:MAG: hypothetical protein AUJ39_00455 [Parcubacteria group bacterium CG1_02_42_13]|nr:MAG: hypothetical protein AUJ39_00455 [Parcubacteria group bacterium CG1_02_42_13]
MFITVLLFFAGFYILIKGSGWVTDGASTLARKLNISTWVIGLVIVGIGASIPEFSIAVISNFLGDQEIALGTIIGSNTFNILLVLGVSALLFPLTFKNGWIERDLIWNIFAVLIASFAGFYSLSGGGDFLITRTEGLIMLILFCVWLYYSLKKPDDNSTDGVSDRALTLPLVVLMIFIGLAGVVLGGKWVVDGAVEIAIDLGVSEKLIGLTIVGIGTSLPELAISLRAAYKRQVGIAVGNIIGSNIFDFLMILGFSAVFSPVVFEPELYVDILVTFISAAALIALLFLGKRYVLTRPKGLLLIAAYILYLVYLAARG